MISNRMKRKNVFARVGEAGKCVIKFERYYIPSHLIWAHSYIRGLVTKREGENIITLAYIGKEKKTVDMMSDKDIKMVNVYLFTLNKKIERLEKMMVATSVFGGRMVKLYKKGEVAALFIAGFPGKLDVDWLVVYPDEEKMITVDGGVWEEKEMDMEYLGKMVDGIGGLIKWLGGGDDCE